MRKGLALDDVNLVVPKGGIVALLGANGAGKTTLFNCITGMIAPTQGAVRFEGRDIASFGAHRISRFGISRTFQNLALFGGLTVLENLMVGAHQRGRSELIRRVRRDLGLTVLIVEHDIPGIMNISDKIVVLDFGVKIAEGTPPEVRSNPAVIAAYRGAEA